MIALQPGDTIAIAIAAGGSIQWSASGLNTTTTGTNTPETFASGTVAPTTITTVLNPTATNQMSIAELSFYNAGSLAIMTLYRQPSGGSQIVALQWAMAAGDSVLYGPGGWQHYNSAGQVPGGGGGGVVITGVPTNEQTIIWNSSINSYVPGFSRSYVTRKYARANWR